VTYRVSIGTPSGIAFSIRVSHLPTAKPIYGLASEIEKLNTPVSVFFERQGRSMLNTQRTGNLLRAWILSGLASHSVSTPCLGADTPFTIHFAGQSITPEPIPADFAAGTSMLQLSVAHAASTKGRRFEIDSIQGNWLQDLRGGLVSRAAKRPASELSGVQEQLEKDAKLPGLFSRPGEPLGKNLLVIQFAGPLADVDYRDLKRAGVILYDYLDGYAYTGSVARGQGSDSALERLARAALPLPAEVKIQFGINAAADVAPYPYLLQLVTGASPPKETETHAPAVRVSNTLWRVKLTKSELASVSASQDVRFISPDATQMFLLGNALRKTAHVDPAQGFVFAGAGSRFSGVSGSGVRIAFFDGGLRDNIEQFSSFSGTPQRVFQVGASTPAINRGINKGTIDHGTEVAGVAAGLGDLSTSFEGRGIAPSAEIGAYVATDFTNQAIWKRIILDQGAAVTNHAHAQMTVGATAGTYDSAAALLDALIAGTNVYQSKKLPAIPEVWSAGNNGATSQYVGGNFRGFYSVFTSAKNSISVGAIDTASSQLSGLSSLGPTFDGRVKPDLVAPGCIRWSTDRASIQWLSLVSDNHTVGEDCGTSFAAPIVAGVIALMAEKHQKASAGAAPLQPSTYKAILIETAIPLTGSTYNPDIGGPLHYAAAPNYATGFGLVDGQGAVDATADSHRWVEGSLAKVPDTQEYCVDVPEHTNLLKVALAWDDPPGTLGLAPTVPMLINDLDLKLKDPTGKTVLPWTIVPPSLKSPQHAVDGPTGGINKIGMTADDVGIPTRAEDHLNNVEMASVDSPTPGLWRVRIEAHLFKYFNPQSFSVAFGLPYRTCSG
jgi:hypothetical protein